MTEHAFKGDPARKAAPLARIDADGAAYAADSSGAMFRLVGPDAPAVFSAAHGYPLLLVALFDLLSVEVDDGTFLRDLVAVVDPGANLWWLLAYATDAVHARRRATARYRRYDHRSSGCAAPVRS